MPVFQYKAASIDGEVFNGTLNIDDVFLGANVFLDDFESGGTALWTASSP